MRHPLAYNSLHAWWARLDVPPQALARLRGLLSPDEIQRADRFCLETHGRRFAAARGFLREVLGSYLDLDPSSVEFTYAEYGKPCVKDPRIGLRFNLSHSEDVMLLAVALEREVGVDIEALCTTRNLEGIAHRFFSRREQEMLRNVPKELRVLAFYNCWTRKEAYMKARGFGLHLRLDSFDVSLAPGEAPGLLATRPEAEEAGMWRLGTVTIGDGFAAAYAVAGEDNDAVELDVLEIPEH